MGSITIGNEYELKCQAYESVHPLGKTKAEEKIKSMLDFLKSTQNIYYMLLCRERNDYTIFDIKEIVNEEEFLLAIKDCVYNRGKPVDIGLAEDGGAYELWIKFPSEDNKVHCYYFFPCDECVIC